VLQFHSERKPMQKPQSWREVLGNIIAEPQERYRIAKVLGISPVTLTRWVNGESNPRPHNLRGLLLALPTYRSQLALLIEKEFDGISIPTDEELTAELTTIPAEFYKQIHHTLPYLPDLLRFSTLGDLILQQALDQLDTNLQGMAISVACCMPPSLGGKVRSLRVRIGRGTPPWSHDLAQQAILLGAESLAGHVVSSGHMEINQQLGSRFNAAPGYQDSWEESAVAAPIMMGGKIAGSLLVSSARSGYFQVVHRSLVESYAELLALAFDPADFYEPELIELWPVPAPDEQKKRFTGFQQRVAQVMIQQRLKVVQAEMVVWQQIERDLFNWEVRAAQDEQEETYNPE
jgi:transcriptional regulator with XRE-family HTH domain